MIMTMASDKRKYVTCDQKSILVDFIKAHCRMIKPKFDKTFTVRECNNLWEQLSSTLNHLDGAKKSSRGWRKCWHDLRRNTKEKVAKLRQQGGPTLQEDLTPIQEKVRALIEENDTIEPIAYFNIKQENDVFKPDQLEMVNTPPDMWETNEPDETLPEEIKTIPINKQKIFKKRLRSFAERKLYIKKSYYNRKLALLERHIQAINRQTEAINKQTVVHERLMHLLNPK